MPRKPVCQRKDVRPRQVFVGSGYQKLSDWLFHLPAASIGQKTELSLLRVFGELLQLHHKFCLPLESLQLRYR